MVLNAQTYESDRLDLLRTPLCVAKNWSLLLFGKAEIWILAAIGQSEIAWTLNSSPLTFTGCLPLLICTQLDSNSFFKVLFGLSGYWQAMWSFRRTLSEFVKAQSGRQSSLGGSKICDARGMGVDGRRSPPTTSSINHPSPKYSPRKIQGMCAKNSQRFELKGPNLFAWENLKR